MSLPTSFTIRPHHEKDPLPSSGNDVSAQNTSTSGLPSIQLSFSGQENDGRHQKPPTSDVATSEEVAPKGPALYPGTNNKPVRRVIRVSPFHPMVHLRQMPKQGTISPLRVHEHEMEQKVHRQQLTDMRSPSNSKKSPPISEVCITTPSSFDCGLSSPASASTFTDYKAMYFQSQKQLKALQKLQEHTLAENHRLRSRINIIMKRLGKEDRPSEASRRQESQFRSQDPFPPPPRSMQPPVRPSFHISGESSSFNMGITSTMYPSTNQARAPPIMREQTFNHFPVSK
eukprot:scaffold20544_cov158-Amphora_coffeaeformis.AAC.5